MTDTPAPPKGHDIVTVTIEEEMRVSYLDYAMSVIVSRALPDVRDGLKPVHRRILYAMNESGYTSDKPYRKSARIVGDVMGRYHPHGDQAIYDAMVRMAQDFSMRLPLLDGQGNFGSMDGDPPAAMRYTEIRMAQPAESLIDDIDKDTVDFVNNYDDTTSEPSVLPARIPNLLANGAGGIAVGMATNIPPHNLGELIDGAFALLDDPDLPLTGLMEYIKGPDFPTGGTILGRNGIHQAFTTGRGSVAIRGKAVIEENFRKDRSAIIISEIPYQVNKSRMVEVIAEAVRSKRIEGISDLRDESDRHGVRVVVEVRRDAVAEVVLNQLYSYTPLQTSFGVNMLALNRGRPEQMNLKQMLLAFLDFREEVITRRTRHLLGKARDRAHILAGLAIAVANIDEVIRIIRGSPDPATAREALKSRDWPARDMAPLVALVDDPRHRLGADGTMRLSDQQARAILDLRLQRLTALGGTEIGEELKGLGDKISEYLAILTDRGRLLEVLREELQDVRDRFATPRRTDIQDSEYEHDIEDLIERREMVVTVSHRGYLKRVPLDTYRPQARGGKGRSGMSTRDEDFVTQIFVVNTHTPVLFFSSTGKVYKMKVYRLPEGSPTSLGKPMVNLLPLADGEVIEKLMPLPEDEESWDSFQVMFATANGNVRRNRLGDFVNVKSNGKIAIRLDDDDRLVGIAICKDDDDVLLAAKGGKCIRFQASDVRLFKGRDSSGVRGMRLAKGDHVISMSILSHVELDTETRDRYLRGELDEATTAVLAEREEFILAITENGYGKRTSAFEYRITNRGGQGIINIETSQRNGEVVSAFPIADSDQVMLVTNAGKLIRMPVHDIRIAGRNTQGVTLFRTAEDEKVVSVAWMSENGDGDGDGDDETGAEGTDDDSSAGAPADNGT